MKLKTVAFTIGISIASAVLYEFIIKPKIKEYTNV
jgi:hypothetical protein